MSILTSKKFVTKIIDESHSMLEQLRRSGILSRSCCSTINKDVDAFFEALEAMGSLSGEEYWNCFRSLFGFAKQAPREQFIPINAANLCPEPVLLLKMTNLLREEYNKNVAQQIRTSGGIRNDQLRRTRTALAQALQCEESELAILRNGSEGNNAVNNGYNQWDVAAGERPNVVLWQENHPTNRTAWDLRAGFGLQEGEEKRFDVRVVTFSLRETDQNILDKFTSVIDQNTRFVSYSQTSNDSGFRIAEIVSKGIWEHVTNNGLDCHVHIDATMEWGATQFDKDKRYCHSFVSSAHKWFLGPKETGILYMDEKKVSNFEPNIFAYDYNIAMPADWREMPNNAHRFEMLGQRDDVNIIALYWTQKMWSILQNNASGDPEKDPHHRVFALATHLKQALKETGWTLITPEEQTRSRGVVRVKAPRQEEIPSLYDYMYGTHQIAGSSGGSAPASETFRLCPHIYNSIDDVNRAITGMNQWQKENTQASVRKSTAR